MTKSRGDSLHCSLVRMTLEANLMVHSQLLLLGRSPGVQSRCWRWWVALFALQGCLALVAVQSLPLLE